MDKRVEEDSLGTIEVPAKRLWGAQTQRSLVHFAISNERMPDALIQALALAKSVCAALNVELGKLSVAKGRAIAVAADEIASGLHAEEFPLSVWQTGSGTQTNMNVNEVIANRASEVLGGERGLFRLVHANDDVNLGHSSNDIFPTAIHLASGIGLVGSLLPALRNLISSIDGKAQDFSAIIKIGRTHLQDALPLTLGQEFSGYVAQLQQAHDRIKTCLPAVYELAIGGTAVGTGFGTHDEFGARVSTELAHRTGIPFRCVVNKFAAIAAHDGLVAVHATLKTLAVALMKIANDLRWLASGPRCGLGEIRLPANEPGSSIMPGKVNPTQCEAVTMICTQAIANDLAVSIGGASGTLELNAFKPLIAHNLRQSIRMLSDVIVSFDRYCVQGIVAVEDQIAGYLERSLMLVTALSPHIGYDEAAEIASLANRRNWRLKSAALELGYVSPEDFDRWVVPSQMISGDHVSRGGKGESLASFEISRKNERSTLIE
jgi:fumarate hydratase class II